MKKIFTFLLLLLTLSALSQSNNKLYDQRYEVLINEYYSENFDKNLIKEIIKDDSLINLSSIYQCLFDESKTKFVAFFAEKADENKFKSKQDKYVNVLTDKKMGNPKFLDIPNTYSYIVKGVKDENRWYYLKTEVTYFNSRNLEEGRKYFFNSLQSWDFFKGKSNQYDSNFWESKLFTKVDKGKGPYEIIYLINKKEKVKMINGFKEKVTIDAFQPFYDNWKNRNKDDFIDYSIMYDKFTLIFPESEKVILNPLLVTNRDNKQRIRYFVYIPENNKFYEWTFVEPKVRERNFWHYGSEIKDELSKITIWNFSIETLDDTSFWNKYVLLKEGDKYKFLKELSL
jgi:hypothetical protein